MPAVVYRTPGYDERLEVLRRRYSEARAAGLDHVEAEVFAENGQDIGLLRALVSAGCEPRLIALIVV